MPGDQAPSPNTILFRQFLRALSGDELVGDAIASDILAQLPGPGDRQATVEVFREGLSIWRRRSGTDAPPFHRHSTLSAAGNLFEATPRMVGVLIDVLAMETSAVAEILEIKEDDVRSVLRQEREARRARAANIDVLIVEDERLIAAELTSIARETGAVSVNTAHNGRDALIMAGARPPHVIIADYDLGEGPTGLDVVRQVALDHGTAAVFVTAYPNEVLTGMDGEPAFVVAKPFRREVVAAALHYAAAADRPKLVAA